MSSAEAPAGWCARATATTPGPIAILHVQASSAEAIERLLAALTGRDEWPVGRLRLVRLAGVDDGLAARVAPDAAELMPHGGPRVLQRLVARLAALGFPLREGGEAEPDRLFPEARDECEALALAALARARSPLAIDLLLDQPRRWREATTLTRADEERSRRLDRLVEPPIVVVAGPPNVGKSTLSNALLGRSMSIALDAPGTTRDYTAGIIDLGGLVVRWHDTPGRREAGDAVERGAIDIAGRLIERADCLVAMTDAGGDWPRLPRSPDLRVAGRADLGGRSDADLAVSALTGAGLGELTAAVRDLLVPPGDLEHPGPWRFDPLLPR